jgi:hypothetical protein
MLILKRSKSALLCPLTVETGDGVVLIGSLELYRSSGPVFDKETESRIKVFSFQLEDVFNLFM